MKKLILFGIVFLLMPLVLTLEECDSEEDTGIGCSAISPAGLTCSTYDVIADNGTIVIDDASASELYASSGLYNFTFNQSQTGSYAIIWCDNTTGFIDVELTDETDLGTVLTNQATLENEILSANTTIVSENNIANETRIQIISQISSLNNLGSSDINNSLSYYSDIDNQTRQQIITDIQNVNNTITVNVIGTYLSTMVTDVWASTTRTLTSFGTLVVDVWDATLKSGTSANATITDINDTVYWIDYLRR